MTYLRMAIGACLIALMALAANPSLAEPKRHKHIRHISRDGGGVLITYAMRVLQTKRSEERVHVSGRCASACTLFLSLPPDQLCITRSASFGFHLPYGQSAASNRMAASYLMRSYPDWVRQWIRTQGGLTSRIKTMNYAYASRFLRTC